MNATVSSTMSRTNENPKTNPTTVNGRLLNMIDSNATATRNGQHPYGRLHSSKRKQQQQQHQGGGVESSSDGGASTSCCSSFVPSTTPGGDDVTEVDLSETEQPEGSATSLSTTPTSQQGGGGGGGTLYTCCPPPLLPLVDLVETVSQRPSQESDTPPDAYPIAEAAIQGDLETTSLLGKDASRKASSTRLGRATTPASKALATMKLCSAKSPFVEVMRFRRNRIRPLSRNEDLDRFLGWAGGNTARSYDEGGSVSTSSSSTTAVSPNQSISADSCRANTNQADSTDQKELSIPFEDLLEYQMEGDPDDLCTLDPVSVSCSSSVTWYEGSMIEEVTVSSEGSERELLLENALSSFEESLPDDDHDNSSAAAAVEAVDNDDDDSHVLICCEDSTTDHCVHSFVVALYHGSQKELKKMEGVEGEIFTAE